MSVTAFSRSNTFVSPSNAIDFGDLTTIRWSTPAGASNDVHGIFTYGRNDAGTFLNTIDKVTLSTYGSAVEFGEMSTVGVQVSGATASTIRVTPMGGFTAPSNAVSNTISSVLISSTGGSEDFGDLTHHAAYHYATSDCHGGL